MDQSKLELEQMLEINFNSLGLGLTTRDYESMNIDGNNSIFERHGGNKQLRLGYTALESHDSPEIYETISFEVNTEYDFIQVAEISIFREEGRSEVTSSIDFKNLAKIDPNILDRIIRSMALIYLVPTIYQPDKIDAVVMSYFQNN
ncbi:MAG: hypothetical protein ABIH82_05975 [Candidatus Woesearchaeota archaeon]